jgi:hypothetical protein
MTDQQETTELRTLAAKKWGIDWARVAQYEELPGQFPLRCSVTIHPGGDGALPVSGAITIGEDLCGSWFQQKNGGARHWCAVAGEFDAR